MPSCQTNLHAAQAAFNWVGSPLLPMLLTSFSAARIIDAKFKNGVAVDFHICLPHSAYLDAIQSPLLGDCKYIMARNYKYIVRHHFREQKHVFWADRELESCHEYYA
jgi:hypothetical protein